MTISCKRDIMHAFDKAHHYHQHAQVQQQVAETLTQRLPQISAPQKPRILEIGCGTGFLSLPLLQRWPDGAFVLSDLSLAMVQRCRNTLAQEKKNVHYAVMDGEQPALSSDFDLIAASLVFQWFVDPITSLANLGHLLRPGGHLLFATLGTQTFREWRVACTNHGIHSGLQSYPTASAWIQGWQPLGSTQMHESYITINHPSCLAFLQGLKAIGATVAKPDYRSQSASVLRQLIRSLDQSNGFSITYHILYGLFSSNYSLPPQGGVRKNLQKQ